jgi:type IV pilus assembly protein PilM
MPAPPVGLDITPSSLVAVTLKKRGKAYGIELRAETQLAPGIVADGEVHDADALGAAIRAFWEEQGITSRRVAIGVANQRCVMRVIELPRIKSSKQLREAISFEVSDNLPIPIEETVWDFHTVAKWKDEAGTERERHVVVMAYRESVERYRDALAVAGLKLVRIDLAAFALMRASLAGVKLAMIAEDATDREDEAVALLDIGPTTTNIVVARNDVCELNRVVNFGRQHFTQTLVEQFGWSYADAERVSEEAGVLPLAGVEQSGDPYTDTRRVMQFVADQFAQELRTSLDYYAHSNDGAVHVSRMVIAGDGALLRGLDMRVSQEIGLPVSLVDVSPRLEVASFEELGAHHPRFATALGLAMEDAA